MPPAFILSQNQTLKFNCLKSLRSFNRNNGSNFVISLLTCFQGCLLSQISISHFFLILFLIYFTQAFQLGATPSRRQLVYHTTYLLALSTVFLIFFKLFLKIFFQLQPYVLSILTLSTAPRTACLSYHFISPLSTLFLDFF